MTVTATITETIIASAVTETTVVAMVTSVPVAAAVSETTVTASVGSTPISVAVTNSAIAAAVTSTPITVSVSALDPNSHAVLTIGTPANGLSLSGQVLSIALASGSVVGVLSAADWTTFSGKLSDAPSDGSTYGRNSGTWAVVSSGITDHSALSNLDYASAGHTGFQPAGSYLTTETDPIVGAINGIVKANGAGVISAAGAGVDYQAPLGFTPVNKVGDQGIGPLRIGSLLYVLPEFSVRASRGMLDANQDFIAYIRNDLAGATGHAVLVTDVAHTSAASGLLMQQLGVTKWGVFAYGADLVVQDAVDSYKRPIKISSGAGTNYVTIGSTGFAIGTTQLAVNKTTSAVTMSGNVSALNLSGTNTGDVTIGTNNGLSLLSQVLSLGVASSGVTGALSGTDWDTFSAKQAALTFPLAANLGGTGVANLAGSTLTLGAATSITGGGTVALGGFTLTIPATGTAALLATANVFTALQNIQLTTEQLRLGYSTTRYVSFTVGSDGRLTIAPETNGLVILKSQSMALSFRDAAGNINAELRHDSATYLFQNNIGQMQFRNVANADTVFYSNNAVRLRLLAAGQGVFGTSTTSTAHVYVQGLANEVQLLVAGFTTQTLPPVHFIDNTATTNAIRNVLQLEARSTGTAAAGFGPGLPFYAETATDATYQQQGLISTSWIDATNVSRKAKMSLSAYDTATRLGIEIEASGTAAKLGFFGVATVVQQANNTAIDTLLSNLGLRASGGESFFDTRLMLPMGEISYFDMTGTAVVIATQSDGSTNMVKAAPATTFSNDKEFDNGGADDGRLRYIGATTRTFHVACTISIAPASANDTFVFGIAKTGTMLAESKVLIQATTASGIRSTAMHAMVSLATNDYLELFVGNTTDADDCTVYSLNIFAMGM
jgi:hypothetical protein